MCVNDLVVQGAEPLFFLDYFATGKLDVAAGTAIVGGIAAGCKEAGCALIGGETAEMPGMYAKDDYDLRSEERTSELQSLMRISYAVFCLKKKKTSNTKRKNNTEKLERENIRIHRHSLQERM